MLRRCSIVLALLYVAALAAQAQTQSPVYDARYVLTNGAVYEGTTTFEVDEKGGVTGRMVLTVPTPVNATLAGTIKEGVWTFKYTYAAPNDGCSGTLTGTAKVAADRKMVSGNAMITGCTEEPLAAVFTFTRRVKK